MPIAAQHANHVWTCDFIFDTTAGKRLKVLLVLDEYTRVILVLVPGRSLTSAAVKGVLARLVARHIEPSKPWQNGYGESFHARLRDECLKCEEF